MTITANYPSISPSLLLDFANTKALDPRITFSRPTTATYYDNHTTVVAEQNLFLTSEQFDNSNWGKTATSVTANTTVAPDGATTADTVTADGTTGVKLISASNMGAGASPATARVVSVYAKAGTNNFLQINFSGDGTPWADYDLSAGTVGSTGSNQTASIVSVGNGWYRCILYTASTTATTCNFAIVSSSTATRNESNTLATTVILWGAQLEQRSSVTAYQVTTTAAITNYIPVLQTGAINEARFDHNPTTRESLGLLIEEQRTNLLTYSAEFDNAAWGKISGTSVTANTMVSPDGTISADTIISTLGNQIQQVITVVNGTAYATSVSILKTTSATTYPMICLNGSSVYGQVILNTNTGVANVRTGVAGATNLQVQDQGRYWRLSFTTTMDTTTAVFLIYPAGSTNGTSYTGSLAGSVIAWGAQLEAGAFATSYVPTVASQVTRSADSASMTGTNFSSWYNNAEGTIYGEGFSATTNAGLIAMISDSSIANNFVIGHVSATNSTNINTNSSLQANFASIGTWNINTFAKIAMAISVNNSNAALNGTLGTTDTNCLIPVVNRMDIGSWVGVSGVQPLNGTIKKIAYYPIRVSNFNLQSLTG